MKKNLRRAISAYLTASMVFSMMFGFAPVSVSADDSVAMEGNGSIGALDEKSEDVSAYESNIEIDKEAVSGGLEGKSIADFDVRDSMNYDIEQGKIISIDRMLEAYEKVNNDAEGTEYIINYDSSNAPDVTLAGNAEAIIKAAKNSGIKLENGAVSQKFVKDAEDVLAPFVYKRSGYGVNHKERWLVKYTETYQIPIYDPSPSPAPAVIGYNTATREVTKYYPFDAKVKELQAHIGGNGTITVYPNWKTAYPVSFNEISLKGADNTNRELVDYVQDDTLELKPLSNVKGYEFKNWKYSFADDNVEKEAVIGTGENKGKYFIDTQMHTGLLTLEAEWEPVKYKINYVGIKVSSNKAGNNEASINKADLINGSVFALEEDDYYIVEEEIDIDSIGGYSLPTQYAYGETLILPTAQEVNNNMPDEEFSEYNRFLCWSKSKKFKKTVKSLGKGGDIEYGDVTLYVIYTAKYPVRELSVNQTPKEKKEFKAVQVNVPNLINTDEYAIINLIGTGVSADPNTVILSGNEAVKYFELCEVDNRKAVLGNGYAPVGIRLKDGIDADTAFTVNKKKQLRKIELKFQSKNHEKDESGNPVYQTVTIILKTSYSIPKYKLARTNGILYTKCLGNDDPAVFRVMEKNGWLYPEQFGGKWEADLVQKNGKTYVPVEEKVACAKIDNDSKEFTIEAYKEIKGFIRLRNTDWIKGAYAYLAFTVKENNKEPALGFSTNAVVLNNCDDRETASVRVIFKNGMEPDPELIKLDETNTLPEGVSASYEDGIITVKGAKGVKKGKYRLSVSCKECKKPAVLNIYVVETKPEKAVKAKIAGKLDALLGGNIFITPKVSGFAGSIESVKVIQKDGSTVSGYDVLWDGSMIELSSNDKYRPHTDKEEINLELTMTTGRTLPLTLKVKPAKGKISMDVYDVELNAKDSTISDNAVLSENSVDTPVIVTYTYTLYDSPKTKMIKLYTIDLSRDTGKALFEVDTDKTNKSINKQGEYKGVYKDGVITLKSDAKSPAKVKTYSLKAEGKLKYLNKNCSASFKLTVKP